MFSFWSHCSKYPAFRQLGLMSIILFSGICHGQITSQVNVPMRSPASYIPDDDVIVKPVDNEISFYQQYVGSDESRDVVNARNQIKIWNDNQVFANQYGLSTELIGSPYFVPTEEEKWQYFKDRYLRYLRRKGEQPLKDMPKNWYQEYRASNEVDTIDEMEARFQKTTKKSTGGSVLPKSLQAKEVSIWKKTKFIFQPRVDQGLVIVGIRAPGVDARAWVGVNGETEINVQHRVDKIGFRAMFNYYAHSGQYFTSLDQRIMENVYARYTASKDPTTQISDNTVMLLYGKSF
jgi:hypothetical protein